MELLFLLNADTRVMVGNSDGSGKLRFRRLSATIISRDLDQLRTTLFACDHDSSSARSAILLSSLAEGMTR